MTIILVKINNSSEEHFSLFKKRDIPLGIILKLLSFQRCTILYSTYYYLQNIGIGRQMNEGNYFLSYRKLCNLSCVWAEKKRKMK